MANEFKPTVGDKVPKADAEKWIDKFENERKKDSKSVFFGRDIIDAILSDIRATGISCFFARKFDEGQKKDVDTLVLVGTMEDGTLLWNDPNASAAAKTLVGGSQTYDGGYICPPYCPK